MHDMLRSCLSLTLLPSLRIQNIASSSISVACSDESMLTLARSLNKLEYLHIHIHTHGGLLSLMKLLHLAGRCPNLIEPRLKISLDVVGALPRPRTSSRNHPLRELELLPYRVHPPWDRPTERRIRNHMLTIVRLAQSSTRPENTLFNARHTLTAWVNVLRRKRDREGVKGKTGCGFRVAEQLGKY